MSLSRSIASMPDDGIASGGKSCGKFSVDYSRRFDMQGYRRTFPERWRDFLRAHFSGPVEVAFFFSMEDASTARHWWNGTNAPSGHFVAHAIDTIPTAISFLRAA